jgi:hypothetical protein
LVIEEIEEGCYADGSTYSVLSAHSTEKGADDAKDAWRRSHQGSGQTEHAFASGEWGVDADWCADCECGAVVYEVALEEQ